MKSTEKKLFRQGDLLMVTIAKPPQGEKKVRPDGILMHGEVTGHCHRVADIKAATVYDVGDGAFLSVTDEGGVAIVHDEHGPIQLPRGDFEIRAQREYAPEEVRRVVD